MRKNTTTRLVIYIKDVVNITGKTAQSAGRELRELREKLGKSRGKYITIEEYCAHSGIPYEKVISSLVN